MVRFPFPVEHNPPYFPLHTPRGFVVLYPTRQARVYGMWNPVNGVSTLVDEQAGWQKKGTGLDITPDRSLFVGTLQKDYWKLFPGMTGQMVVIRRRESFSFLTVAGPDEEVHGDTAIAEDCLTAAVLVRKRFQDPIPRYVHTLVVFDL